MSHGPLPAVILAAGEGLRLRRGNGETLKPLTPLLGLTLLERAVLSCKEVGVQRCYVVIGSEMDRVVSHVKGLARRTGMTIRVVENPEWKKGNGTSALAAAPYVTGAFLLIMCDHVFDPDILRCLIDVGEDTHKNLLAVDRRMRDIFDLADATKVLMEDGSITDIGKKIRSYNAIDTGIFLCRPSLFEALKKAGLRGDGTLTSGVCELVSRGEIGGVDIAGRYWMDVDTRESLVQAERLLLSGLSKRDEDGFVSRYLNRPLSRYISERLAGTSIRPNTITVLSFLACLGGALLFCTGEYLGALWAGLLVQFASVLDGCDGEIARLKFMSSRFGGWLDTILDRYADMAITVGISYGQWQTTSAPAVWLGGAVALSGFVLASYTKKEYALRYGRRLPGSLVETILKRDVRLFTLFLGALLNRPFEAMVLMGILSHLGIGWLLLTADRKQRKLHETEKHPAQGLGRPKREAIKPAARS
jgi:CDP-L-myo-inositol myo-inositolphosphotransferase